MNITLHPTKGVNPYLTFCPRCKGEANELMLIGAADNVCQCDACDQFHIGSRQGAYCKINECRGRLQWVRKLGDHERLPASQPCDTCRSNIEWEKAFVAMGGVYWQCDECHSLGVVPHTNPYAAAVREAAGTPKPEHDMATPQGVTLEKGHCPVCSAKGSLT